MKIKLKPLVVAATNGKEKDVSSSKQTQSSNTDYTTNTKPIADNYAKAIQTAISKWPEQSSHEKAAKALAGGLIRSGWDKDKVQGLLKAISEKTGMDSVIPSKAIASVLERSQKGEKFFGWPTLIKLTSQEIVNQLKEELGLTNNGSKAPQSNFEILDEPSIELTRPLALIEGRGYAASWLNIRRTVTQTTDENGLIITHNPPKVIEERSLLVMRNDGVLFGTDDNPLNKLGFTINLNEAPQISKLWSSKGVKSYKAGERVDPKIVFEKLCDVIDTFMDFDHSITSQRTMCELIASFIMATWFLDSFNVISQLWLNGERGSGKSQLLTLISQTSYLGQITLAGSSFASLRDIVDSGSTLCLDEAENLEPQKLESNKRELLLSGNRRGSLVTLKKKNSNNEWQNHYIHIYSAKVFAAIERPDTVLASRVIIIPLIRTANKLKANIDPQDFTKWPHDSQLLNDELWALALSNLGKLSSYEAKVNELSSLTGRLLEPWRAILAVALWLDEQGATGLWERMNNLSQDYQRERQEFDSDDVNSLIIRALCECLGCEIVKLREVNEVDLKATKIFVLTSTIEAQATKLIGEFELNIDYYEVSSRRIGKKLSKMRFEKARKGGSGNSGWKVSEKELARWINTLGIRPYEDK